MDKKPNHALIQEAIETLAAVGMPATFANREAANRLQNGFDGALKITFGKTIELRPILIQRHLNANTLGAVQMWLATQNDKPLLITDYVAPPLANRMRKDEIQFIDTAGNAYLRGANTLIWVQGQRRPATRIAAQPTGRAFEPGGLRVLFALLCDPQRINRTYRQLALDAGVAHGTVGWVMADLQARGFVVEIPKPRKQRKLLRTELLMQQWVEAYARVLRPKLQLARYKAEHNAKVMATPELPPGILVGGEIAAAKATGFLKPATATFWADGLDPHFVIANRLRLDPAGNIELVKKFWTFPTGDLTTVPDLLTYADLLAIGDARTLETARLMQGPLIDRLLQQT